MKVFISYHRTDEKYRDKLEKILRENNIKYYAVPKDVNFDGLSNQYIKDLIVENMKGCDVVICLVGNETYTRPHVDWELHHALKGCIGERKGIIAVMLENRGDNKNKIDLDSFPNRLKDNMGYIVLEQFASLHSTILEDLNMAKINSYNKNKEVKNNREPMKLRNSKYYQCPIN